MGNDTADERRCLVDNSVYARASEPAIVAVWADALRANRLVASGPFLLEALYSVRDADELVEVQEELTEGLPYLDPDSETWRLARAAQLDLCRAAPQFHRRPPVDYLIGALAHQHELDVFHYDTDYDLIAEHSRLEFESRWVVPQGSLDEGARDVLRPWRRGITARLGQFTTAEDLPVFEQVVALLDKEIAAAGKSPLSPVSES